MSRQLELLRELLLSDNLDNTPTRRVYHGEWFELCIGIGDDDIAYVTIPSESFAQLLKMTTCQRTLPPEVDAVIDAARVYVSFDSPNPANEFTDLALAIQALDKER